MEETGHDQSGPSSAGMKNTQSRRAWQTGKRERERGDQMLERSRRLFDTVERKKEEPLFIKDHPLMLYTPFSKTDFLSLFFSLISMAAHSTNQKESQLEKKSRIFLAFTDFALPGYNGVSPDYAFFFCPAVITSMMR